MTHTRSVPPSITIEVAPSRRTVLSERHVSAPVKRSHSLAGLVHTPKIALVGLDPVGRGDRQASLDSPIEAPRPLLSP
jgi:hypothetical protein